MLVCGCTCVSTVSGQHESQSVHTDTDLRAPLTCVLVAALRPLVSRAVAAACSCSKASSACFADCAVALARSTGTISIMLSTTPCCMVSPLHCCTLVAQWHAVGLLAWCVVMTDLSEAAAREASWASLRAASSAALRASTAWSTAARSCFIDSGSSAGAYTKGLGTISSRCTAPLRPSQ